MLPNEAKFEDFCSNFSTLTDHPQQPNKTLYNLSTTIIQFLCIFLVRDCSIFSRPYQFFDETTQNARFWCTKKCFLMAYCHIDRFKEFSCVHNKEIKQEKCVRVCGFMVAGEGRFLRRCMQINGNGVHKNS